MDVHYQICTPVQDGLIGLLLDVYEATWLSTFNTNKSIPFY